MQEYMMVEKEESGLMSEEINDEVEAEYCFTCPHCEKSYTTGGLLLTCKITGKFLEIKH